MTVVGIDDTDSRSGGMCTTYLATRIANEIRQAGGHIDRQLLVRLNPTIEHKTRGNAAIAIHTDCAPVLAEEITHAIIDSYAVTDDPNTNPGAVIAPHEPLNCPEEVAGFAHSAVHDRLTRVGAMRMIESVGYRYRGWKNGRGLIGALAAVGSWADWCRDSRSDKLTYERISYRRPERWGTTRDIDTVSVFRAANSEYPTVWDTVDPTTRKITCSPNTPCPVLYGIRGDDPSAVERVAHGIVSEPVHESTLFLSNQGTDVHLQTAPPSNVDDGQCYCITGGVRADPETRRGGHVFVPIESAGRIFYCVAFEPTKRFRDTIRRLRTGDHVTACGEVTGDTIKLEKIAIRKLNRHERVTPSCPTCGRTMKSAGRYQGYRCRRCATNESGKIFERTDRTLESGWYEVPPSARRHLAKPLVRGGFDDTIHPSTDRPSENMNLI